ncbi:MAG TPA: hypothetical protein VN038_02135 [Dyadobacter sp.]|nr:hypothetical protein [Dyadobacter sp.]
MKLSAIRLPGSIRRLLAAWAILYGALPCAAQIRYFQPATIQGVPGIVKAIPSAVRDTIAADTVFQVWSKEGYPARYYKKIRTSVCFDNKCRLLKCTLYWNITGRYLGFELEKGEYLSKAKHKPFKRKEYARLHAILADPFSRLAGLSYGELAPRPKETNGVDAVTSATAANVLDEVVPGAAYTTYKMWHVVYGATQEEVRDLTAKSLSPDLILQILDSPDPGDRTWALNHIRGWVRPTPELRGRVLSLIGEDQFNLAERAIHSLDTTELGADTVQAVLTARLSAGSYAIKKLIVAKLAQAPGLRRETVAGLVSVLNGTNPELTSNVIDLFTRHRITDSNVVRDVASLLTQQNAFIARKAYHYLHGLAINDQHVERQIKVYENRQEKE